MHSSQRTIEAIANRVIEMDAGIGQKMDRPAQQGESFQDKAGQLRSQPTGSDRRQPEQSVTLEEENRALKKQLSDCMLEIRALQDILKKSW